MLQCVAKFSPELAIHIVTTYNWRKSWQLQGEVLPSSEKDHEAVLATDKFTVVLETARLNATVLSACCRERGLYPESVHEWRQASQNVNEIPMLTLNSASRVFLDFPESANHACLPNRI